MQIEVYRMDAEADSLTISLEAVCDSFSSLLWDIEYYQCGSFEVYIAANPQNLSIFQTGRIVGRDDDSQHFGMIETVQIDTDAENGDYLTVRGALPHVPAGAPHHSLDIQYHSTDSVFRYCPECCGAECDTAG